MIHPTAIVNPGARLAENVSVGPYSVIGEHVVIGSGTTVAAHVVIEGWTEIGCDNQIFQFASIGAAPQDLKYAGEETYLKIGDRNLIREFTTFSRGTAEGGGLTTVGNDNLFMAYAHVAHDCIIKNNVILVNAVTLAGHVEIGEYAIVGGLAGVHQFIHIGKHAMVSGGSLVRKDVPPYIKAAKEPLSYIGINSIGLRRRGFLPDKINEIQNIYRILFQQNNNTTQASRILEAELDATPERDEVLTFIKNSQRGIMKGYTSGY